MTTVFDTPMSPGRWIPGRPDYEPPAEPLRVKCRCGWSLEGPQDEVMATLRRHREHCDGTVRAYCPRHGELRVQGLRRMHCRSCEAEKTARWIAQNRDVHRQRSRDAMRALRRRRAEAAA